jgi:hypothetical protein
MKSATGYVKPDRTTPNHHRRGTGGEAKTLNTIDSMNLELPPDARYLPAVLSAADIVAGVCGLDKEKALRLRLAADAFFLYLCRAVAPGDTITIAAGGGRYYARLSFRFKASQIDLRSLNFTAVFSPEDDSGEMELGLFMASRTTDRFRLEHQKPDMFLLTAEVDKAYPETAEAPPVFSYSSPFRAASPDPDILTEAAMIAASQYPAWHCPKSFFYPGRFLDMLADGYYTARAVLDAASRPAGLICWHPLGERGIALSGPFVFTGSDRAHIARLLTEAFLESVARSKAICALSERATDDLPLEYFDLLGTLDYFEAGCALAKPAYYRLLAEDTGAAVFAHHDMEAFLRKEYDRLALLRDILPATATGEAVPEHSVLSTTTDQNRGLAGLWPLYPGRDMAANLSEHAAVLTKRSLPNILVHMDLSSSWQAAMAPDLIKAGFVPKLIMPNAGKSDILIFQYASTC